VPRKPRDAGLTFFIDECIKSSLIEAALNRLKTKHERLQVAKKGTLDEDWLREAGMGGWVCFSRDRRMMRRPNELNAITYYRVALFTLDDGTGPEHAQLIADALPVVRRAALELKRAFIARIEPNAVLSVLLERGAWLERARRMKPLKGEI
jgi:hypothetical protein